MDKKKIIVMCAAIAVTASFVTGLFVYFFQTSQMRGNELRVDGKGNYDDLKKYMEISDLELLINENFYQQVEEKPMLNGTLKGMVSALGDPYSVYYTEDEYKEYKAKSEADLAGIGVSAGPYQGSGQLKVERVYSGSPAESAGIKENDVIVAVDGVALAGLDYESAFNMLRGPNGSNLTLTVVSGGQPLDIPITRATFETQYVTYAMLDSIDDWNIAQIVISEFNGNCVEEFKNAIEFLKNEGADGVIIDVRGNMDGSVKNAADMLNLIIPEGSLGYSVDKNEQKDEMTADADYFDIPVVVLTDANSASAAEIFAGAVQDRARGKVVGSKTYGKGVIQVIMDMPYSGGGVKLTTAVYYTPNGNLINGAGITPDVPVDPPADLSALTFETDTQLQQAIATLRETGIAQT
ncbi:MAG: S41 family peptidase [Christensenella sp.]|uniref:S41 family peptidase n=1 Tax=Christensenella sp. TaxID=1935934 RepID=UPI002B217505|nr:S41 family peptidase [Christensenella sp.]MEA5002462.1 S41 family peptidase [Christensenella sp.]